MVLTSHRSTLLTLLSLIIIASCTGRQGAPEPQVLFESGAYPSIAAGDSMYYYLMQSNHGDSIVLYAAPTLEGLSAGEQSVVATASEIGRSNYYSPEIIRIKDSWYAYFESDDGNSDNHQIYVLENKTGDPMNGQWELHGPVITTDGFNFGIHPTVVTVNDRLYMLWSGWQKQRTETETQCIFIAEMENPWTLKSERVMISMPQFEWERQWINPNGHRSAYPIFVNENPEAFISPDGKNLIVCYSASGIWTIYNSLGVLYASTDSDLLEPLSWTKLPEPSFLAPEESGMFGASNISVVDDINGDGQWILYQIKSTNDNGDIHSHVRMKRLDWDEQSLPVFGSPI